MMIGGIVHYQRNLMKKLQARRWQSRSFVRNLFLKQRKGSLRVSVNLSILTDNSGRSFIEPIPKGQTFKHAKSIFRWAWFDQVSCLLVHFYSSYSRGFGCLSFGSSTYWMDWCGYLSLSICIFANPVIVFGARDHWENCFCKILCPPNHAYMAFVFCLYTACLSDYKYPRYERGTSVSLF